MGQGHRWSEGFRLGKSGGERWVPAHLSRGWGSGILGVGERVQSPPGSILIAQSPPRATAGVAGPQRSARESRRGTRSVRVCLLCVCVVGCLGKEGLSACV